MGMYTELVLGVKIKPCKDVIVPLRFMLNGEANNFEQPNHPFFQTERWEWMLGCDSYYFDGKTNSELVRDDLIEDKPMYFLNVRCNLKNYNDEIELFLDWLCPYIETCGFLGYERYEEDINPILLYKDKDRIIYKTVESTAELA